MVEPAHPGSNSRLDMGARIYLDLFQDLTGDVLSVVGDVPVNSETPVVTSSTSRSAGCTVFLKKNKVQDVRGRSTHSLLLDLRLLEENNLTTTALINCLLLSTINCWDFNMCKIDQDGRKLPRKKTTPLG